jgi:hypothetical protein
MADLHPSTLSQMLRAPKGRKGTLAQVTPEQFERLKKWTRRAADLPKGVRVRCVLDSKIDQGYIAWTEQVNKNPRSYTIRIDARVSFWHCADLLLHEFVHVRQWIHWGQDIPEHGIEYGREFAYVYQRWVLENPSSPVAAMVK